MTPRANLLMADLDEEEDNHEGTSRALRRPSRTRNADAPSVRQSRGRNRRNRRSVVRTRLLLLQDQRQRRQFVHFAFRTGSGGAEWELTMFQSRGAHSTPPDGQRMLARSREKPS